ncbi:hypothetical protein [Hoeflea sp.]|uniref:hypothetical protein n=1 Tax=Hoeflea sp. TaxID=1940281 RepID=UPI003B01B804
MQEAMRRTLPRCRVSHGWTWRGTRALFTPIETQPRESTIINIAKFNITGRIGLDSFDRKEEEPKPAAKPKARK